MSYAEIEAELHNLDADELRRLALKSWTAFVQKEGGGAGANLCDEDDATLLTSLDEAIVQADRTPGQGSTANEVRGRLDQWISK
jgi:hypothetical protein